MYNYEVLKHSIKKSGLDHNEKVFLEKIFDNTLVNDSNVVNITPIYISIDSIAYKTSTYSIAIKIRPFQNLVHLINSDQGSVLEIDN